MFFFTPWWGKLPIILLFCAILITLPDKGFCKTHQDKAAQFRTFTFYTRPPGASIYLSFSETGNKQERAFIGFSGKSLTLDLGQMKGHEKMVFFFELSGYELCERSIQTEYFLTHTRYPENDAVTLTSAIRHVTFLTEPDGADIYLNLSSHPQNPEYLGKSGKRIVWDLSRFELNTKCTFTFKLWGYEDYPIEIENYIFNKKDKDNFYPGKYQRIELKPRSPVVIPLYYWGKRNFIAVIVTLSLLSYVLFSKILPYVRQKRQQQLFAGSQTIMETHVGIDDSMFGHRIGNYRIMEKIGAGGMAKVYRAIPESPIESKEAVAVKLLQSDMRDDPEFCKRFQREICISRELVHPNIVKILDFGDHNGLFYMVMEFVDGQTLRKLIPKEGFSLEEFMNLYGQILSALDYAHRKGIIHRDLKPENIMIKKNGKVLVMDFGLARGYAYTAITMSGTTLGTPVYMSPEQISGKDLDDRSDQYSLGVIAYQMLTGSVPFWNEQTVNIIYQQLTEAPPPLRQSRPDIPVEVESIVLRMLEKDMERRFHDVKEVHQLLEKSIQGHI